MASTKQDVMRRKQVENRVNVLTDLFLHCRIRQQQYSIENLCTGCVSSACGTTTLYDAV